MYLDNSILEQQHRIKQQCQSIKPVVVIQCLAYNHESYIRDALEGFIIQKTDFPFVAIVHDDASTDKTAEIVKEYAEKYPEIILPIFEIENQYSKRNGSLTKIMNHACEVTGAKYIAMCEGDDYWTDPLKLQKQVDFLESNSDYTLCFHPVNVIVEPTSHLPSECFRKTENREYKIDDILTQWTIPTCSVLLKIGMLQLVPQNKDFQYGDNVLWLTCASNGKIYCINQLMGVYRRQSGGWMSQDQFTVVKKQYIHCKALKESFPKLSTKVIDSLIIKFSLLTVMSGLRKKDLSNLKIFIGDINKYKGKYIYAFFKYLGEFLHI